MSVHSDRHTVGSSIRQPALQSMAFRETARSGTDLDELSEALSTPNAAIKMTAERNTSIAYHCNFISVGDVSVGDCSYEGTIVGKRDGVIDRMSIFLPTQGNMSFGGKREPIYSVPGRGVILEPGNARDTGIFGPRRHLCMFIDQAMIARRLTHMFERTISGGIDIHPDIDLTSGPGLVLQQIVSNLHSGLSGDGLLQRSPLAVNSFCEAAVYLLLETCSHRYSEELARPAPAPAPRHVKRAIDYMREHIAEPLSLDDIAVVAEVSVRTLQQGFRQFRNTTPMSYLHELRMQALRQDLLECDGKQSIAEIALRWGFVHLGRLAAEYRKRFGELPSQTLKR
ncbi:AraC family transcriptional regulator protein (plasmid) [Rhizobium sp. CIAT894]|uniref:helix-turn-helix transcriptional regulator n=1 Tax=Rhizobium sp. CIAT894 TaxID=2020312 RepID=UPI000A1ECDFF|nr:AraC family transcriptional regulator [Rhizobium sp. CIAT894]ARM92587.1 AraC family transcriptional regulator protein [Rhizobium sp. CIAT894]